jgi:hypothetical protein
MLRRPKRSKNDVVAPEEEEEEEEEGGGGGEEEVPQVRASSKCVQFGQKLYTITK